MQHIFKAQDSPAPNPTDTFLSQFRLGNSLDPRSCGDLSSVEWLTLYRRFGAELPIHAALISFKGTDLIHIAAKYWNHALFDIFTIAVHCSSTLSFFFRPKVCSLEVSHDARTPLFVSEIKVTISVITGSHLTWFPDFYSVVCERTTEVHIRANPVTGEGICQVAGSGLRWA